MNTLKFSEANPWVISMLNEFVSMVDRCILSLDSVIIW